MNEFITWLMTIFANDDFVSKMQTPTDLVALNSLGWTFVFLVSTIVVFFGFYFWAYRKSVKAIAERDGK